MNWGLLAIIIGAWLGIVAIIVVSIGSHRIARDDRERDERTRDYEEMK